MAKPGEQFNQRFSLAFTRAPVGENLTDQRGDMASAGRKLIAERGRPVRPVGVLRFVFRPRAATDDALSLFAVVRP